ncbi:MAG: hypothetical protein ACUVX1_03110 [Chloroflexota bacterium]|mgnify:CR=1 FL=1
MDSRSIRHIAMLTIHPEFARRIFAGQKNIEFRKVRFQRDVSHVVVYAGAPVRSILGYFEVAALDEASPRELWSRYGASCGTLPDEFQAYFDSHKRGMAIKIGTVNMLKEPLPLSALDQALTPPQCFVYLTRETFDLIRAQE